MSEPHTLYKLIILYMLKKIDFSLLKRDILAFEKEIYKDKIFVNAIVSKWGEK